MALFCLFLPIAMIVSVYLVKITVCSVNKWRDKQTGVTTTNLETQIFSTEIE